MEAKKLILIPLSEIRNDERGMYVDVSGDEWRYLDINWGRAPIDCIQKKLYIQGTFDNGRTPLFNIGGLYHTLDPVVSNCILFQANRSDSIYKDFSKEEREKFATGYYYFEDQLYGYGDFDINDLVRKDKDITDILVDIPIMNAVDNHLRYVFHDMRGKIVSLRCERILEQWFVNGEPCFHKSGNPYDVIVYRHKH